MTLPARDDRDLWRGDTRPLAWGFGPADAPADLTGSTFRLVVTWWASRLSLGSVPGSLALDSPGGLTVDLPSATVTWPVTADQTAGIPRGARVTYELKRLIGQGVETWAHGRLTLHSAQDDDR